MIHSDTLYGILAIAATIPIFAIFLFAPGYSFGLATNLLQFRDKSITEKYLLALPFSIVISTALANIAGRYIPATAILWIFIASAVATLFHVATGWIGSHGASSKKLHLSTKIALLLAALWALIVIASLVDITIGEKLYTSTTLFDHGVRIAFIHSALRSGLPPANPFSYLGHAPGARYYYYWYVVCSYPVRLAHISPRYVLYGSSAWVGFSLAALIPIYLKYFAATTSNLRRKSVLGILLLSITGLDIIPTIYEFFRAKFVYPDMEWWDPVQITSWQDALLWVPHHVAALVACFIGFLALWSVRVNPAAPRPRPTPRIIAGIFAALAFAAAAGLSVYVTFTFAFFLLCWGLRLLYKRAFADFFLYFSTGCLTIFISLPYLHDLLSSTAGGNSSTGKSSAAVGAFAFGIRQLPSFLSTPYFLKMHGFSHPGLFAPFGVVIVYLLEFGFFAIVAVSRLRRDMHNRRVLDEATVASWYLIAISFFVITFIRSAVIANNDLAYRSAMIAQFILLLWGVEYLDNWIFSEQWSRPNCLTIKNSVVIATLILGFSGTLYSLAILRTYIILDDAGAIPQPVRWLPLPPEVGSGLFNVRQAYRQLDQMLPSGSIVQYNPMTEDYLPLLEYDKFQSVDAFPDCGTEFGGDSSKCPPVQQAIANLFNQPGSYDIHQICSNLSIDVLVARKTDPAWQDRTSWVWRNPPIVENSTIRAFQCE